MIFIWLIVWHYPFLTFHWCYFILGSVALAQSEEFKIISDVSAKGRVNSLLGRKCTSQICCNIHWNHLETNGKNTLTYTFSWWQQFQEWKNDLIFWSKQLKKFPPKEHSMELVWKKNVYPKQSAFMPLQKNPLAILFQW